MNFIRLLLLKIIIYTISNIFTVGSFVKSNKSPHRKKVLRENNAVCERSLCYNQKCEEIFQTVAIIKNDAPNLQRMIPRKKSPFITADKYLIMGDEYFSSQEYCIVNLAEESTAEVKVCKRDCNQNSTWRPCIPKCCLWGESVRLDMNTGHGSCVHSNESKYTWKPDIYNYKSYLQILTDEDYKMGFNAHYYSASKYWKNKCKSVWIWHSDIRFSFHMLQDGNVRWRYQTNKWFKVRRDRSRATYCFDKQENSEDFVLRICFSELIKSSLKNRKLYAALAFVSAFFIFLLVMMYASLAKEQNSHGWIQFLFFLSLFFFYFLEGIGLLILPGDLQVHPFCYVISVAHHFFFTLTTTTLVALSVDIFLTFWNMHPGEGQLKCLRNFYISAAVSTSSAFFLVLCAVLMNMAKNPYGPPYGMLYCSGTFWVVGKYLSLIFVLFSCVTLFSTVLVIYKYKATTKILVADTRTFYKDLGKVLMKLIIVQGGMWTGIMIVKFMKHYRDRSRYNDIIQIILHAQSVLFFLLFAHDKRKIKSLRDKYPRFKALTDALCSVCRRKIRKTGEEQALVPSRPTKTDSEHK